MKKEAEHVIQSINTGTHTLKGGRSRTCQSISQYKHTHIGKREREHTAKSVDASEELHFSETCSNVNQEHSGMPTINSIAFVIKKEEGKDFKVWDADDKIQTYKTVMCY